MLNNINTKFVCNQHNSPHWTHYRAWWLTVTPLDWVKKSPAAPQTHFWAVSGRFQRWLACMPANWGEVPPWCGWHHLIVLQDRNETRRKRSGCLWKALACWASFAASLPSGRQTPPPSLWADTGDFPESFQALGCAASLTPVVLRLLLPGLSPSGPSTLQHAEAAVVSAAWSCELPNKSLCLTVFFLLILSP